MIEGSKASERSNNKFYIIVFGDSESMRRRLLKLVRCPLKGANVQLESCRYCRYNEGLEGDTFDCSYGEVQSIN